MKLETTYAEIFNQTLDDVRSNAPAVGLAALSGKTPNTSLYNSWKSLNDAGINLQRGVMNYRWRALREANPNSVTPLKKF